MQGAIGLYIHVPFCKAKCFYCDFNSYSGMEDRCGEYFETLNTEIQSFAQTNGKQKVKSIFVGGGTPSFINPSYISNMLKVIYDNFDVQKDAEISIESNPGTLTFEKLSAYTGVGINRLSIGLQAWQDRLLSSIGRIHNKEQFLDSFDLARRAGFKNINADIIFALPTQTHEEWVETVRGVIDLGCEHVSCYSLSIEENTIFYKMAHEGTLSTVSDETDRDMYHDAIKLFSGNGYEHYEISNFAKPGFQCRHNLVYWNTEEYLGFGAGAHSYFKNERYNNIKGIDDYIRTIKSGSEHREIISFINKEESMSEFMILGLRLIEGVNAESFKKRYGENIFQVYKKQIETLSERRLIIVDDSGIRLSKLGLDLANQVFVEFI